jgi:putative MATE family efflux protein
MSDSVELPDASLTYIWRLAWPNIITNILLSIVSIAHLKIISPQGAAAVAAVTTGHRFFFLLQAIIIALAIAAAALVSQAWGANNKSEAEKLATTAVIIGAILAIIIALPIALFPDQVVSVFGMELEAQRLASDFVQWLALFNVAFSLNIVVSGMLRAVGDVINPLRLSMISCVANVSCSMIFANGWFGAPEMGVAGLAVGSGLAVSITTVGFLGLWHRGTFRLKAIWIDSVNLTRVKKILHIGLPVALEQGIIQASLLGFLAIVALYGTAPYAAYGIGVALLSFSFVIGLGFGIANATITGQLVGAQEFKLAKKSGWSTTGLAIGFMSVFAILLASNAESLAHLMTDDMEVITLTKNFIYILALAQPIMAIEFSLAGALRGAGDTRFPLWSTFIGLLFGRILLALIFVKLELGIYWIFSVALIDFSIKASLLTWRFQSEKWHSHKT